MTAYTLLCTAAAAVLAAAALLMALRERSARRREKRFARRYMQMITVRMLGGQGLPMMRFPMCDRRGAREVLARLLATASASTAFEEPAALRRIMVANGIESWLLRRIKHSHGYARARWLATLSALPVSHATAEYISRTTSHRNRHNRFRTMLVEIAADPSSALRILGRYPHPLTPFEMNELTAMLRRGMLPLAYAPLLASPCRNLRMLGLNIIRIFGITESEHLLVGIISDGQPPHDDELRNEAVYVLAALHLPVSRRQVAAHIRSMSAENRRALLRRLASEGYSVAALMKIADDEERSYVEALAASYKRTLVCQ